MSGSITLSPKHGVNPGLTTCYLCNEESVSLILYGRMSGDKEAPRKVCTGEVCNKCKDYQKQGIILISIRDGEGEEMANERRMAHMEWERSIHGDKPFRYLDNPYRTGGWVVIKEDAIERMLGHQPETLEHVKKARILFVEQTMWDAVGLPATPETKTNTDNEEGRDN